MIHKEYWFWLSNLPGIGIKKINELLTYFHDPESIYEAKEESLRKVLKLSKRDIEQVLSNINRYKIQENYAKLNERGIYFVTKDENEYPEKLRSLWDAPIALYIKGELPKERVCTIAIIGARNCSAYGKEMASYYARELAKAGVQIISGLARGIDGYAHQGALMGKGLTFGVLGCGINICYPREHTNLYHEVIKNGGMISEYGLGVEPRPGLFPMRNRIISGLSDGILVIEAKEKSGSLITTDMGLDQGKDIFALPGRVTDALSYGCNNLIKMGAEVVMKPSDILDYYQINYKENVNEMKKNNNLLETEEKIVYARLSLEPKHINSIMIETGLNINQLMEILISLELNNFIKQTVKNYYTILV